MSYEKRGPAGLDEAKGRSNTKYKNIKKLSVKNTQLEEKFNDLLQYLRTNSIEIANI